MKKFKIVVFLSIFVCCFGIFSSALAATNISNTNRYAYSENLGWVDFGTAEGNVIVANSELTGYAWSENAGWISLNCANDNDGCSPSYKVVNDGTGNLSGYAYSENTGWINFAPTGGGVTINPGKGIFSGWAWSENAGWISFNCLTAGSCTNSYEVSTTWREQFTLNYSAGENGSIIGTSAQTVNYGADGTLVTAVPSAGYHFVSWSDAYPRDYRTDTNIIANKSVTATFVANPSGGGSGILYTPPVITPAMTQEQTVSSVEGVLQSLEIYLQQSSTSAGNQAVKIQIIQQILRILTQILAGLT